MHPLFSIIEGVEKTHPGLGTVLAMAILSTKANLCLLVVSPAGCGKSITSEVLRQSYPDTITLDSVTTASLSQHGDTFQNFHGLVIIDDMGKIGDTYSRKHTLTAFAELCYSHFITRYTYRASVLIADFFGSAILNIQPSILAEIYQYPEWESVIQDKTLRYYHLYRPCKPNVNLPSVDIDWGIDTSLVLKPDHRYKLYSKLEKIASIQWSDARVLEHLDNMLKASAALARRQMVTNEDFKLLYRLMKPMVIERYIMVKMGFETGRYMDTNRNAALVEFASWKNLTIDRISRDYKIQPSRVYDLLSACTDWFEPNPTMTKSLKPKRELLRVLKEAGVER